MVAHNPHYGYTCLCIVSQRRAALIKLAIFLPCHLPVLPLSNLLPERATCPTWSPESHACLRGKRHTTSSPATSHEISRVYFSCSQCTHNLDKGYREEEQEKDRQVNGF